MSKSLRIAADSKHSEEIKMDLIDDEIRQTTLMQASPEDVYDALTTAKGLDSWFTEGSEVEAHPNGKIIFRWKDWGPDKITVEDTGVVLEAVRPTRFVFQWHGGGTSYFTTVEIDIESTGEGTLVKLREHGYQNTPEGRHGIFDCATGWGEALTLVKFFLEHNVRY
jgi:uncharacterized protein YndB with AHSA1/START domain